MSRSCDDYLRQMGYREYSRYLSFHFPFTHERSLLEHLRACPWKWNQSHFKVRAHASLATYWLVNPGVGVMCTIDKLALRAWVCWVPALQWVLGCNV